MSDLNCDDLFGKFYYPESIAYLVDVLELPDIPTDDERLAINFANADGSDEAYEIVEGERVLDVIPCFAGLPYPLSDDTAELPCSMCDHCGHFGSCEGCDKIIEGNFGSFALELEPVRGTEVEVCIGAVGPVSRVVGEIDAEPVDAEGVDPFENGACYYALFKKDQWPLMFREGIRAKALPLSVVAMLTYAYELERDRPVLAIKRPEAGPNAYHFRYPLTRFERCQSAMPEEWLTALVCRTGLFAAGKTTDIIVGMPYKGWDYQGPIGRAARGSWIDISKLSRAIQTSFEGPFSKQSHRDAMKSLFQDCYVRDIVTYDVRFPARGVYASVAEAAWESEVRQIIAATMYRDKAKDDRAKQGVNEPGSVRESTFGESLVSFTKGIAKICQSVLRSSGLYTRSDFEREMFLTWDGDDDTVPSVWVNYGWKAAALAAFPWINTIALGRLIGDLRRQDPTLNVDLAKIGEIVYRSFLSNPPFSRTRRYPAGTRGSNMSLCLGDWANKFAVLLAVAGYYDGTKDDKFKVGQHLSEMKKFDRDDNTQQYNHVLGLIDVQYARHDWFIASEADLDKEIGLKVPPKFGMPHNPRDYTQQVIDELKRNSMFTREWFAKYETVQGHGFHLGQKSSGPADKSPSLEVVDLLKTSYIVDPNLSVFYCYKKNTDGTLKDEFSVAIPVIKKSDVEEAEVGDIVDEDWEQ